MKVARKIQNVLFEEKIEGGSLFDYVCKFTGQQPEPKESEKSDEEDEDEESVFKFI